MNYSAFKGGTSGVKGIYALPSSAGTSLIPPALKGEVFQL